MQSKTLELYDLDGTLNEIDVPGALEGKGSVVVRMYFEAAARFLCEKIPSFRGSEEDVLEGIKKCMGKVFPYRALYSNWATFRNTKKN